jgi:hypothetical protein
MRRFFSLFWGIVVVVGVPVVGIVLKLALSSFTNSAPHRVGKSDRREAANSLKLNARWRVSSYVQRF